MKKVILVGGTAYSGSTFFHMMLANDPKGYACGEVRSLLAPRKPNHRHLTCSCGKHPCIQWQQVRENKANDWAKTIFNQNPNIEIIVASSKSPIWIQQQNQLLKSQGIDCRNILIWKTPAEFGQSMKRRGFFEEWERSFVNYYRLYATLIDEWRAVKYEDLVKNDEAVLKLVCEYLEIPYFEGKASYWEREYHVLAGNSSAKFHLYDDQKAKSVVKGYDSERLKFYRNIYYRAPDDEEVLSDVKRAYDENAHLLAITEALTSFDINAVQPDPTHLSQIAMPMLSTSMRILKDYMLTQIGKVRYRA